MSGQFKYQKAIFTGFIICSGAAVATIVWRHFRKPILRALSRVKLVEFQGQMVLRKEDVLRIMVEVKTACREELRATIKSAKSERRKHKADQKLYEKIVKRMEKDVEHIITSKLNSVLENYALTQAILSRSIDAYNDPEIHKANAEIIRVHDKQPIKKELEREVLQTFEKIQRNILDSTDLNSYSDVLYHQIVDVIHEKYGIELDEIAFENGGEVDFDFRARFEDTYKAESMLKNLTLNESK